MSLSPPQTRFLQRSTTTAKFAAARWGFRLNWRMVKSARGRAGYTTKPEFGEQVTPQVPGPLLPRCLCPPQEPEPPQQHYLPDPQAPIFRRTR